MTSDWSTHHNAVTRSESQ
ncbi:hypothetical protein M3J09_002260 [Ascochyta lentis]